MATKRPSRGKKGPSKNDQVGADVEPVSGWRFVPVRYEDQPEFLQDNEYLLDGHRPQIYSLTECAKTVFRIHTETGNIWSHLAGSIGFILFTVYYLLQPGHIIGVAQKMSFSVYFSSAILCMGCSAFYHTFQCHSPPMYSLLSKVDYFGIIVLIVLSFCPWLHYGFYCRPVSRAVYFIIVFGLGIISTVVILHNKFSTPPYRSLRAALFIALGLSGVLPALDYCFNEGVLHSFTYFSWLVYMALVYIAGGVIYALRIPEKLSPGNFDIWGQSHQILHLCVVAGAIMCYYGADKLATARLTGHLACDNITSHDIVIPHVEL